MNHLEESLSEIEAIAKIFDGKKGFVFFGECMQDALKAMRIVATMEILLDREGN